LDGTAVIKSVVSMSGFMCFPFNTAKDPGCDNVIGNSTDSPITDYVNQPTGKPNIYSAGLCHR
jgi:hypothetical protein